MLHAQSATTATPVRPSALFDFLPTLFGADYVKAEACIYAYAAKYIRDYSGGEWTFNQLPDGAGYLAPEEERVFVSNPDNGFEGEMSGDAAGIIATLTIMNWLSWQVADMGPEYARVCKHLVSRQDALKDYISIIHHPERHLIWRAID